MGLTFDLNANVSMLPITIFTLETNQYVSSEANEILRIMRVGYLFITINKPISKAFFLHGL